MEIEYRLKKREAPPILPQQLGFGKYFTEHFFEMDYSNEKGWHNAVIKPLGNIEIHPAAMIFHYGQTLFEGLKAYHTVNNEIVLFRPEKNIERLNNSARRICMPEVNPADALQAIHELVAIEKDWVPKNLEDSLYIRPFMIADEPAFGVRPSATYKFFVMLSPVGPYYPEGFKPIKILVQDEYVRAVRKGLGECKTAANYAASLLGVEVAKKEGYTQVLWLDAVELKYIEEVGTMNIFVRFNDEIVTPKLTGGILPGITRNSVLKILRDKGLQVSERLLSLNEVVDRYKAGEVLGIFGTGTAAVISSVSHLRFKDMEMVINNGEPDDLAVALMEEISGIQRCKLADKYGWITKIIPLAHKA